MGDEHGRRDGGKVGEASKAAVPGGATGRSTDPDMAPGGIARGAAPDPTPPGGPDDLRPAAGASAGSDPDRALRSGLREIALRATIAGRLEPPGAEAVLRSIVEATVILFDAEAASIALHEPAGDRLVFRVAAGASGAGAVGLEIPASQGIAGYVFATGQPLAVADVATDPRFGHDAARATGYVPRSILAVPLVDDEGTIGVLEVLDRRGDGGFALRDLELAAVFARQATVAIRASRVERDVAELLRAALGRLAHAGPAVPGANRAAGGLGGEAAGGSGDRAAAAAGDEAAGGVAAPGMEANAEDAAAAHADDTAAAVDAAVASALEDLAIDDPGRLWPLVDAVARARAARPDQIELIVDVLDALARRPARGPGGPPGRPR